MINTSSRLSRDVRAGRLVKATNGSMTRAIEAESPTGIRELLRNTTVGPGARLRSPGRPIVAVLSRAGRNSQRAGLTSSRADRDRVATGPAADRAAAPFPAWTGAAAQRVISAIVGLRAGRVCHPAEVVEAAASAAVPVVVVADSEAVAVAEEAGGKYEDIPLINTRTLKGEENETSRNEL